MLLVVVDGNGDEQTVVVKGQIDPSAIADLSGTITALGVSQPLAAANALRSGLYVQNTSADDLTISELGDATLPNSFVIEPGKSWPPENYDVPTGEVAIAGPTGNTFVAREW